MKLLTLMAGLLAATALQAAPVYNNSTTDTLNSAVYSALGASQIGDQIHLGGTARLGTSATVQFYELGGGGTFSATLSLFAVNAANGGGVGALLGSFSTTGSIAQNDVANVSWSLSNLALQDDMIFTVAISNLTAGMDLGLNFFDPPTVGTSDNQSFVVGTGSGYATGTTQQGFDNLFFMLDAADRTGTGNTVPEPASTGLVLSAFLGLAAARKQIRRRR